MFHIEPTVFYHITYKNQQLSVIFRNNFTVPEQLSDAFPPDIGPEICVLKFYKFYTFIGAG